MLGLVFSESGYGALGERICYMLVEFYYSELVVDSEFAETSKQVENVW